MVTLKNMTSRPRMYDTINKNGEYEGIRFKSKSALELDPRVITPVIARCVYEGKLALISGEIPNPLNPYTLGQPEEATPATPKAAAKTTAATKAQEGGAS